jgi:hypothetical protein
MIPSFHPTHSGALPPVPVPDLFPWATDGNPGKEAARNVPGSKPRCTACLPPTLPTIQSGFKSFGRKNAFHDNWFFKAAGLQCYRERHPFSGTLTMILVPRLGPVRISKVPFSFFTLAVMLENPNPFLFAA